MNLVTFPLNKIKREIVTGYYDWKLILLIRIWKSNNNRLNLQSFQSNTLSRKVLNVK